ncbi:MAG: bifunctional hydroxymethylpyrimidine kinase/phosphomethylpyrimidine kinase [Firmicutes bacterium]|nr:bifunctional hydroxymethylpyrimidine kinase/phosphomethylpyrimidine kinase [Bacillota bacterium]
MRGHRVYKNVRAVLADVMTLDGKGGLSVSLPVLASYGVKASSIVTSVIDAHPRFEMGVRSEEKEELVCRGAAAAKARGCDCDIFYIGAIMSAYEAKVICEAIDELSTKGTIIVYNPSLGDDGAAYPFVNDALITACREIAARSDYVTPNVTESKLLSGLDMGCDEEKTLDILNAAGVIITGVRRENSKGVMETGYIARIGHRRVNMLHLLIDGEFYGAGDVFASVFAGELAGGADAEEALSGAAEFCLCSLLSAQDAAPAFEYIINRKERGVNYENYYCG